MKLSYVRLPVRDVHEVSSWYSRFLDLGVTSDKGHSVLLSDKGGGPALEIYKGKPLDHPEGLCLGFEVKDLTVTFKRRFEGRLKVLSGPQRGERGRIVARLQDPGGHTVELFELEETALQESLTIPR